VDVMVERCAGLDVHRDDVVATVRVPGQGRRRWDQQTRTFRATLAGLSELAAWLAEFGVTLVGMEATGVYWKTVFQALEDRFECWLLNGRGRDGPSLVRARPAPRTDPSVRVNALGSCLGFWRRTAARARDAGSAAVVAIGSRGATSSPR